MTAYRQQALACASALSRGRAVCENCGRRYPTPENPAAHVYGWFDRAERGFMS